MKLDLQSHEVTLLHSILTNYLSDLRMEISNTEDYDMRESMKKDEEIVKSLIQRFGQSREASA